MFGDLKEKETYNLLLSFRKRKVFRIWGTGSKVSCLISTTYPPESRRSKKMFEATHLSTSRSPHRQFWCETTKMIMSRLLTTHPGGGETQKRKVRKKPKNMRKKGKKSLNNKNLKITELKNAPHPLTDVCPTTLLSFRELLVQRIRKGFPLFNLSEAKSFL